MSDDKHIQINAEVVDGEVVAENPADQKKLDSVLDRIRSGELVMKSFTPGSWDPVELAEGHGPVFKTTKAKTHKWALGGGRCENEGCFARCSAVPVGDLCPRTEHWRPPVFTQADLEYARRTSREVRAVEKNLKFGAQYGRDREIPCPDCGAPSCPHTQTTRKRTVGVCQAPIQNLPGLEPRIYEKDGQHRREVTVDEAEDWLNAEAARMIQPTVAMHLSAANMFTTRDKNGDELEITCHAPKPGFTAMTQSGDGSDLDVFQAIALRDWLTRRIKEASEVELKAMIADDSIADKSKRNVFRAKYGLELECEHPELTHRGERGGHYCTTCSERV